MGNRGICLGPCLTESPESWSAGKSDFAYEPIFEQELIRSLNKVHEGCRKPRPHLLPEDWLAITRRIALTRIIRLHTMGLAAFARAASHNP